MPVIGVREFSSKVSRYIGQVEQTGEPLILTNHGRPIVAMMPLDADRLHALTVAAAPRLLADLAQADAALVAGQSRSMDELIAELDEQDEQPDTPGETAEREIEVGEQYSGTVVKTSTFGAFIELAKGTDGLLHISNLAPGRHIDTAEEILSKGDEVNVRVVEVDRDRGLIGLRLADDPELTPRSKRGRRSPRRTEQAR